MMGFPQTLRVACWFYQRAEWPCLFLPKSRAALILPERLYLFVFFVTSWHTPRKVKNRPLQHLQAWAPAPRSGIHVKNLATWFRQGWMMWMVVWLVSDVCTECFLHLVKRLVVNVGHCGSVIHTWSAGECYSESRTIDSKSHTVR